MTQNTFPNANTTSRLFFSFKEDMICNQKATEIDLIPHNYSTCNKWGEKLQTKDEP